MIDRGSTPGGVLPPLYGAQQENAGQYSQHGWYGQHGTVPSGVPGYPTVPPGYHPQSRVAAACLAFFLGGFGAHNFYIGLRGRAIVQLCVPLGSVAIIFLGAVVMLIGLGDPNVSYGDDEVMTGLGAAVHRWPPVGTGGDDLGIRRALHDPGQQRKVRAGPLRCPHALIVTLISLLLRSRTPSPGPPCSAPSPGPGRRARRSSVGSAGSRPRPAGWGWSASGCRPP